MKAREARLQSWLHDPDVTIEEMYARAERRGYTKYIVETQDSLIAFVEDNIKRGMKVTPLIASIENNAWADYYAFDVTSYSNLPAKPIYTKQELLEALS